MCRTSGTCQKLWENIDSVGYDPVTSTSGSATTQHAAFTARPRRGVGGKEAPQEEEEEEEEEEEAEVLVVLMGRPSHRRRRSRAATAATQPRQIEASVRPSS